MSSQVFECPRTALLLGALSLAAFLVPWPCSATTHFYGEGTNTTLDLDFNLQLILDVEGGTVSGHFDATETPGDPTACGKGDFVGAISGNDFSFSFTSDDDDPGCGSGSFVVSNEAHISANGTMITATYTINGGESEGTWTVYRGVEYFGTGFNITFRTPWVGGIHFSEIGAGKVVGYLDADGLPDDKVICGAGVFAGTRTGASLVFSFRSSDPDPGCGFDFGERNDFVGTIAAGDSAVSGTYTIEDGQKGTFSFDRRLFADDFEAGNTSAWDGV